jgi:hypothetical protein
MGHSSFVAFYALLAWAPLCLMLFAILPSRRAMVVGAILSSVLLPPVAIDLPGVPPYTRYLAAFFGILFGTLFFDTDRILSFRPRWFDLPILVFCMMSPYASAISNDLGPYEGISSVYRHSINWLLPYLIGRLYLTDAESFRELAIGMIVASICLIPFCLIEMRVGAQLQQRIYGTGEWEGARDGSYRAKVFFQSGLALGLWLNTSCLAAWWLWRTGRFRSLWGLPSGGVILPSLVFISVLCRARGATLLGLAGWLTLWSIRRYRSGWMLWILMAVAPTYYYVRITDTWTGQNLVDLIETNWSKERAQSIKARLLEERVLIARALKRPWFGWGAHDESMRVVEDEVADTRVPTHVTDGVRYLENVDSFWSIILGHQGFVGLVMMTATMILPVVLFRARFPLSQWDHPAVAPATVMVVILSLFMLDGLSNSMFNPVYLMIAGGAVGLTPARVGLQASAGAGGLAAVGGWDGTAVAHANGITVPGDDRAAHYQSLGRAAKDRGRLNEVEAAWQHALDLLTESLAAHPGQPALRRRWCDGANDLAWLLAGAADPAVRDPAGAVALASRAVEMEPECSTYWNTLGAAHYRAGDFRSAIADLGRAVDLSDGGTAFDHVFLAMAHARLGDPGGARAWLDRAMTGLGQHPPGHAELRRLCEEARSLLPATSTAVAHP